MVAWLTTFGLPHGTATVIVVVAVTANIAVAAAGFSSQLLNLAASLPDYRTNIAGKIRDFVGQTNSPGVISRAAEALDVYQEMITRELSPKPKSVAQPPTISGPSPLGPSTSGATAEEPAPAPDGPSRQIIVTRPDTGAPRQLGWVYTLTQPFAQIALTFLFTLFLLAQYKDLRDRVVRVVGTDFMTETTAAMSDAGERLSSLFLMQALLNAGFAMVVGCALAVIDVPNPVLWGIVSFFMRFVPFIGSLLAAVPPVMLAMAVDPGWSKTIATIALFLVGEPFMGHVVEPLVLGKRVGLSPFAMIFSASFWTLIWGPIGLILAAPLTMICVVLGRYVPSLEFLSVLLGDDEALTPPQEFYHRLLSGDVLAAVEQFEKARDVASVNVAVHDIVLPALRIAAYDHRRGRLERQAVDVLSDAVNQTLKGADLLKEPGKGTTTNGGPDAPALLIPARGPIDIIAAQVLAACINHANGSASAVSSAATGLTAVSGYKSDRRNATPSAIGIVTAGTIDGNLLSVIAKKAQAAFPAANIAIFDAVTPANQSGYDTGKIVRASKLEEIAAFAAGDGPSPSIAKSEPAVAAKLVFQM